MKNINLMMQLALIGGLGCGPFFVQADSLTPYSVEMHIHGHSNHNGGPHPASMEYHSVQAATTGYADVIWWSDHTRLFDQWKDFFFDTSTAALNTTTLNIEGLNSPHTSPTHLEAKLKGGSHDVSLIDGTAIVSLRANSDDIQKVQSITYELRMGNAPYRGFRFSRPLSSEAVMKVNLLCDAETAKAWCEIQLGLAYHHVDNKPVQQNITYRIDSDAEEKNTQLLSQSHVLVTLPVSNEGFYILDILDDARLLENGDDNTVNHFFVRVAARDKSVAKMKFSGVSMFSRKPEIMHQVGKVTEFAERYENLLGVIEHIGLEFGTHEGHLNGFLPRSVNESDPNLFDTVKGDRTNLNVKDWSARVQGKGGVVSLNHPFGPGTGCGGSLPDECIKARAEQIVLKDAYGANLIEVGYTNRGLGLLDHLKFWDVLTANKLLLYGTGVSDSHGNAWERASAYTTWILSRSANEEDLIDALKSGRVYFGNPKVWKGEFSFTVGDYFMGDRVRNPGGNSELTVHMEPRPENVKLYLVQGLLQEGLETEYLHFRTPIEIDQSITIDTSKPSFVRLEAINDFERVGARDVAAVFSNPIVFLPEEDVPLSTAAGRVFEDIDQNEFFSNDVDKPIEGARLILRWIGKDKRYTPDGDDEFFNVWSDGRGEFEFSNLRDGGYWLSAATGGDRVSAIPSGAIPTIGNQSGGYHFTLIAGEKKEFHFGWSFSGEKQEQEDPGSKENDVKPPSDKNQERDLAGQSQGKPDSTAARGGAFHDFFLYGLVLTIILRRYPRTRNSMRNC